MVKWILAYLVVGVIVEIGVGVYAGYYKDKMGFGDMTSKDMLVITGIWLKKNNNLYYKFISVLPNPIGWIIGNVNSIVFWPIHSIWIHTTHKDAMNSFAKFYNKFYNTKYLSQTQEES